MYMSRSETVTIKVESCVSAYPMGEGLIFAGQPLERAGLEDITEVEKEQEWVRPSICRP